MIKKIDEPRPNPIKRTGENRAQFIQVIGMGIGECIEIETTGVKSWRCGFYTFLKQQGLKNTFDIRKVKSDNEGMEKIKIWKIK